MKGIVFTEFLDLVDQTFSPDITEEMIIKAAPKSGGVYTATSTYDHQELIDMVVILSGMSKLSVRDLVKSFGQHLFRVFSDSFPVKVNPKQELFEFLESVENYIHVEVRKLYPDAALPTITCTRQQDDVMDLQYASKCPFADLAEGLIEESASHFKTSISLRRIDDGKANDAATFTIKKTE